MTPISRLLTTSSAAIALVSTLALTGCALNTLDSTSAIHSTPAFNGKAFGGPNPIIGATVKIYSTGVTPGDGTSVNAGYGVGTLLQEANQQGASAGQDTDSGGSFSFAGGYNCPAGQFAYIVISGGNTGANTVNPNSVLVAALGRCEDLFANVGGLYTGFTGTTVYVNELTTVAAAYALGRFSSETGTGAATQVLIGAPSTNNAAKIGGVSTGCVANGTTCLTTQTAGLAHAFLNAANIISPFTNARFTNGANATVPSAPGSVVPQALINSIGNVLITCVNSTGGAAPGGVSDGTPCGKIFAATTIGTSVPQDTFAAMVNLAANPTLGGSGAAVANFFNLASPTTSAYSPTLSATTNLNDLSIAISYPNGMPVGGQTLLFPTSGALDINDNYYAANQSGTSSGNINVISLASNGTPNGASAPNVTLTHGLGLSVDAIGNGYFVNGSGSGTSVVGAFNYSTAGVPSAITIKPALGIKAYNTAVDKQNNVWLVGTVTSAPTVAESPAGAGTFTGIATPTVGVPGGSEVGLAIDPDQNVWVSANTTLTTTLSIVPNTGSVSTPTYSSTVVTGTLAGKPSVGVSFVAGSPFTAYVSFYNTTPGIQPIVPTIGGTNNATVTSVTPGTLTASTISGTFFNAADGAGNIWLADTNSHSIGQFNTTTNANFRILPCYVVTATNLCTAAASTGKPIYTSVDSTGSVWTIYQGATGAQVAQIIGSAAPTWPLLSLGLTGKP